MGLLIRLGRFLWRFMVIFSFIVNVILVIVVIALGLYIFEIKNQVAEPLVEGLHSSFVGLDQATIDWTIPVRDQIPVQLDIPLETDTVVTLTEPVPLEVDALIDLPGINAYNVNATVNLDLPEGLELPVALDLDVGVDQPLDVALDVRAVIPLEETQLHDVAQNLRLQLEPLAIALNNLPNNYGEAANLAGQVLRGDMPDLLEPNEYSQQPWPGYSMTAGMGYDLAGEPVPPQNIPQQTGIVPIGGIPPLDQQLRPQLYEGDSTPQQINQAAQAALQNQGLSTQYYQSGLGDMLEMQAPATTAEGVNTTDVTGVLPQTQEEDQGIITPQPDNGG